MNPHDFIDCAAPGCHVRIARTGPADMRILCTEHEKEIGDMPKKNDEVELDGNGNPVAPKHDTVSP